MTSLTLAEAKRYCRIDADNTEEDEDIEELIIFSKSYLLNAGVAEIDSPVYRLAQKMIICDKYDNRGGESVSIKTQNALTLLMTQLQRAETITSNIEPAYDEDDEDVSI